MIFGLSMLNAVYPHPAMVNEDLAHLLFPKLPSLPPATEIISLLLGILLIFVNPKIYIFPLFLSSSNNLS